MGNRPVSRAWTIWRGAVVRFRRGLVPVPLDDGTVWTRISARASSRRSSRPPAHARLAARARPVRSAAVSSRRSPIGIAPRGGTAARRGSVRRMAAAPRCAAITFCRATEGLSRAMTCPLQPHLDPREADAAARFSVLARRGPEARVGLRSRRMTPDTNGRSWMAMSWRTRPPKIIARLSAAPRRGARFLAVTVMPGPQLAQAVAVCAA